MVGEPSDDEMTFRELSVRLADSIEEHLVDWVVRGVQVRAAAAGVPVDDHAVAAAVEAGERCRDDVGSRIRFLLGRDIDDQDTTPLVLLRDGVSYATAVLAGLGVPPVGRDEFERRAFPLDIYRLAPASLSDVHESLTEPGLAWGAAKVHMHRRRHSPLR